MDIVGVNRVKILVIFGTEVDKTRATDIIDEGYIEVTDMLRDLR